MILALNSNFSDVYKNYISPCSNYSKLPPPPPPPPFTYIEFQLKWTLLSKKNVTTFQYLIDTIPGICNHKLHPHKVV